MPDAAESYTDIEVDISEEEVAHLIMAGMVVQVEGSVLALTAKGNEYLHQWCNEQIERHNARSAE